MDSAAAQGWLRVARPQQTPRKIGAVFVMSVTSIDAEMIGLKKKSHQMPNKVSDNEVLFMVKIFSFKNALTFTDSFTWFI